MIKKSGILLKETVGTKRLGKKNVTLDFGY